MGPKLPRTRSQIGKLSCRKGKAFEREVAAAIRSALSEPWIVKRGLQCRGGRRVPDVSIGLEDGHPLVALEFKHMRRTNPKKALEQCIEDAGAVPLRAAVCRDGGQPLEGATVTMTWGDWLALMEAWSRWKRTPQVTCRRNVDGEVTP